MDGHRFDEIARSLAAATSRRRVRTGLGGGLAGALAASLTARRAAADHNKPDHCAKAGQQAHPHKPCCPPLVPSDDDGRCVVQGTCQTLLDRPPGGSSCVCFGPDGPCPAITPCAATTVPGGGFVVCAPQSALCQCRAI